MAAYREALARALAEVGAAQARYRELGAQVLARRGALEAAARAYRSGTTEGAKEIARLNDAYRRFAAEAGEAAREREAVYRRAREEFESWRGEGIERLRRAEQALARRAGEYAARKGEHDRALRELNRRIDTYNERVHAGDGGEAREPALLALAGEITAQEEVLAALREQALALAGVIEDRRGVLAREREALVRERGERERVLAGLAEAVLSAQQDSAARITARRAEVQAQIEDVEAGFRAELRSLSAGLSAAERRIESEFGSAPEALLTAVAEWTGSRDPSLLYHAGGAERFERSPPRSAALYDAVDAVRSARRGWTMKCQVPSRRLASAGPRCAPNARRPPRSGRAWCGASAPLPPGTPNAGPSGRRVTTRRSATSAASSARWPLTMKSVSPSPGSTCWRYRGHCSIWWALRRLRRPSPASVRACMHRCRRRVCGSGS